GRRARARLLGRRSGAPRRGALRQDLGHRLLRRRGRRRDPRREPRPPAPPGHLDRLVDLQRHGHARMRALHRRQQDRPRAHLHQPLAHRAGRRGLPQLRYPDDREGRVPLPEMTIPLLFQPIELRGVRLRNRVVISPMCQYSAQDGHVTDWHMVHLGKFAQGGAGAVFMEATAVERRGRITHGDTGIWDDAHVPGLKRITEFVKSQGATPAIQLAHAGRKASMARPWYGNGPLTQADSDRGDKAWSIVAPAETPLGDEWLKPRPPQKGDLEVVKRAFVSGARRAHAAGFEIAEL